MALPYRVDILENEFESGFVALTSSRNARIHYFDDHLTIHFNFKVNTGMSIPKNTAAFDVTALWNSLKVPFINRPPSASYAGWDSALFYMQAYGRIIVNSGEIGWFLEGASVGSNFTNVAIPEDASIQFIYDYYYDTDVSSPVLNA